jgi:hypothetical protein
MHETRFQLVFDNVTSVQFEHVFIMFYFRQVSRQIDNDSSDQLHISMITSSKF